MLFRLPRARVPAADSESYYIAFRLPIKPLDRELPDRVEGSSGALAEATFGRFMPHMRPFGQSSSRARAGKTTWN